MRSPRLKETYEKEIDRLVYKFYGLTDEEIGIVENSRGNSTIKIMNEIDETIAARGDWPIKQLECLIL